MTERTKEEIDAQIAALKNELYGKKVPSAKSAPMPPPPSYGNLLGGMGLKFGQGATFGTLDEMAGGLNWLDQRRQNAAEGAYEGVRDRLREAEHEFERDYPWTSFTSEAAGALVPSALSWFGGPATGAPTTAGALGRLAPKLQGLFSRTRPSAQQGLVGGVSGGASGWGASNSEDLSGQAIDTGLGTGIGAFGSMALPPLARTVMDRGKAIAGRWLPEVGDQAQRGYEKVLEAFGKDGLVDIDAILNKLRADKQRNLTSSVADVGPNTARLAETVGQYAGPEVEAMQHAFANRLAKQKREAAFTVEKGLQAEGYHDLNDRMQRLIDTYGHDAYKEAYAAAPSVKESKALREILDRPTMRQAWKHASDLADTWGEKMGPVDALGNMNSLSLQTLNNLRSGLWQMIQSDVKEGKNTPLGEGYKKLYGQLTDAIEGSLEGEQRRLWQKAREQYRGPKEIQEALRLGREDVFHMDPETLAKEMKDMYPSQIDAVRAGFNRQISDWATKSGMNINLAHRILGSEDMMAKLKMLHPEPKKWDAFVDELKRSDELFVNAKNAHTGSPTARRLAAKEAFEDAVGPEAAVGFEDLFKAGLNMKTGNVPGVIRQAMDVLQRYSPAWNEKRANVVARVLRTGNDADLKLLQEELEAAARKTLANENARVRMQKTLVPLVGAEAGDMPADLNQ